MGVCIWCLVPLRSTSMLSTPIVRLPRSALCSFCLRLVLAVRYSLAGRDGISTIWLCVTVRSGGWFPIRVKVCPLFVRGAYHVLCFSSCCCAERLMDSPRYGWVFPVTDRAALALRRRFRVWWALLCSVAAISHACCGSVRRVGGCQWLVLIPRCVGPRGLPCCFGVVIAVLALVSGSVLGSWEAHLHQGRPARGWQRILTGQGMSVISHKPCPRAAFLHWGSLCAYPVASRVPGLGLLVAVSLLVTGPGTMADQDRSVGEAGVP